MSEQAAGNWNESNQAYLNAHLERIRSYFDWRQGEPQPSAPMPVMASSIPAALDKLCSIFSLSPFERDILLLCAGIEFNSQFGTLCGAWQGDAKRNYPTFSMALALLPGAYWSALNSTAPLRRWYLVEVDPAGTLVYAQLRIDERLLHYLAGVDTLDRRLEGQVRLQTFQADLPSSQQELAAQLAAVWMKTAPQGHFPVLQLIGSDAEARRQVAAAACQQLGYTLCLMPASTLPTTPGELDRLLRLWQREAVLSDRVLFLECDSLDSAGPAQGEAVARFIDANNAPLILASRQPFHNNVRTTLSFTLRPPSDAEQLVIWTQLAGVQAPALTEDFRRIVAQFSLSRTQIETIWSGVQGLAASQSQTLQAGPESIGSALWNLCRVQTRPGLDDLAQRIEPSAGWNDLVLPAAQKSILEQIVVHVHWRSQVYDAWDFGTRSRRGLGISALFSGESGVGKTLAAEVLANELNLDLYRIDLSAVVSKYIGETEKNLRRVFDAAEDSGAILLFDEADALFGKRSEVKDSHDRYANIEISYLLQRMEVFRGLVILTSNFKDALDRAFLRRIRFIVHFPFPDEAARASIWQRVFPKATPTQDLNVNKLAHLNLPGGNIHNIALNAAFLAAEAGEPVSMTHLLLAARSEYVKLEKPMTASETRGWDENDH